MEYNLTYNLSFNGKIIRHNSKRMSYFTGIKYGYLYNWYAATDVRNITANGWSVPSSTNWMTMINYLGGTNIAGGKLKETELIYWNFPNDGATNEAKFNGRGAGYRRYDTGVFTSLKMSSFLLSSTEYDVDKSVIYNLRHEEDDVLVLNYNKKYGSAIRPIKDSTTLSHGQSAFYTGNDGKIYRTICIGTQEWLADNLAETKYRNGNSIPYITDNTAWANLITGALCSYKNDWTYIIY